MGQCTPGRCADACNLGDSQGGAQCELYDVASAGWVSGSPEAQLNDRSRSYNQWLRRDGLYYGGVSNAVYSDPPAYTQVIGHRGVGDSAIWTGTYLGAEALKLKATGSADARQNIRDIVDTLHLWFNITGDPGVLARWAAPAGQHSGTGLDCTDPLEHHCGITYDGQTYDYQGHISRDQYQGVMLGYALAYEALGPQDEATRALIREDVVELVEELMMERTVTIQITVDGRALNPRQITVRFMVLNTREMQNGAIQFVLDTGDYSNSIAYGYQEFMPNWGDMLSQIPLLGWLSNVPRADSAIMLSSFFRVAMLVTDQVPGYETQYQAFSDFYYNNPEVRGGNVNQWIGVADGWFYRDDCGDKYYGNNIAMEPMYNWARLETDSQVRQRIFDEVLTPRMWQGHRTTKNTFFSYIYSGATSMSDPAVLQDARAQLAMFPAPPRVRWPIDLRQDPRYQPHESGCADQTDHGGAVDVSQRPAADFLWQRNPWRLYDPGWAPLTYPGVDYLVAYWMGRHYGFIDDDTPGRCLAWH